MQARTVGQVIDQAIQENRRGENVLYVFSSVFVVVGVLVICVGLYQKEGLIALSGSISGALFMPAFKRAEAIRRQNLMIRLLQAPLENSSTAEQALDAIRLVFLEIFRETEKSKGAATKSSSPVRRSQAKAQK